MDEGRFQVAAGAVIERKSDGKILLILRSKENPIVPGIWELPIGRLKQFEALEDGLRREVQEETGIDDIEIVMPINTFDFMRGEHKVENEVKAIVYWCSTKKERVIISDEHDDHAWLNIDEAIEKAEHKGVKADLIAFRDLKKRLT